MEKNPVVNKIKRRIKILFLKMSRATASQNPLEKSLNIVFFGGYKCR
jgi:hypothetical protein